MDSPTANTQSPSDNKSPTNEFLHTLSPLTNEPLHSPPDFLDANLIIPQSETWEPEFDPADLQWPQDDSQTFPEDSASVGANQDLIPDVLQDSPGEARYPQIGASSINLDLQDRPSDLETVVALSEQRRVSSCEADCLMNSCPCYRQFNYCNHSCDCEPERCLNKEASIAEIAKTRNTIRIGDVLKLQNRKKKACNCRVRNCSYRCECFEAGVECCADCACKDCTNQRGGPRNVVSLDQLSAAPGGQNSSLSSDPHLVASNSPGRRGTPDSDMPLDRRFHPRRQSPRGTQDDPQ